MILSYSRGSIVNIVMSTAALIWLRKRSGQGKTGISFTSPHTLAAFAGLGLVAAIAVETLLPSFSANYWSRITGSVQYIASSPNGVLSGRLTNWMFLGDFLWRQPWTAIFGIGYKTLPYSDYAGAAVVADNTYLQLLVETGIIGLAAFLLLNASIIRTGLRAARCGDARARIFGDWIFCFWIGQMVQMLSGDLITYWRVLPVYFWVLAIAAKGAGGDR
jgi:O-antigen ligase